MGRGDSTVKELKEWLEQFGQSAGMVEKDHRFKAWVIYKRRKYSCGGPISEYGAEWALDSLMIRIGR